MYRFILIYITAFCFTVMVARAQDKRTADSLISVLPTITNDSAKARALNRIALFYSNSNTDSALKYATIGLKLAKQMNWQRGMCAFYTCFGNTYATKALYDSSDYYHQLALATSRQLKDSVNIASCLNNLGVNTFSKADYVNSIKYFTLCLKIAEQVKSNYYIALAAENIGNTYYYQKNYTQALIWAKKSLQHRQVYDDVEFIPSSHLLIGMVYREMKQYDSAFKYLQLSLEQERNNGNLMREAAALTNIAQVYAAQKNYKQSVKLALEAQKIWDKVDPNFETALENTGALGYYYLQTVKYDSMDITSKTSLLLASKKYLTKAIEQGMKQNNRTIYSDYMQSLAEVCMLTGDYKNAYLYYKQYNETQDSIYSQESKNKIAASISQLEIDKKNSELELKNLTISTQKKQKIFYIAGIAALAVIGGLLFYQNRTRKKTNTTLMVLNSQLDEANKIKAKFFAILSHDLRRPVASLVNFLNLQKNEPGLLSAEQAAVHQQKITHTAEGLLNTMEDMLLWSKSQMQQFQPSMTKVSVSDLFSYIQQFFAVTENIKFEFKKEQAAEVYSDENYLRTIMQNLTANAVKALQNTSQPVITWAAYKEGSKVFLSITDNGPGIGNEQIQTLQQETAIAPNEKTGFGMHLVRDLAKAIACTITVQSNPGNGTRFTLAL